MSDNDNACSRPKRIKKEKLDDSDIENELFAEDDTDDDFLHDDGEDDDGDESDEKDQQLTFSAAAVNVSGPSSSSSASKEQLNNINLPSTGSSQQSQSVSIESIISSSWSTKCESKNFTFNKQNDFFRNLGLEPIDFFNFFFEDELLSFICEQTNAQAAKLLHLASAVQSRIKSWKEVTISELRIFLGLLFHMGTIPLSRIQDYWKTDRLFAITIFRQQMARNRFLLILRCLHFTSEAENAKDPLFKIRRIIDYFNNKMETCYYPAKELSLNESMVIWRGRLRFKQYTKNKRQKYGLKLYMLTEPDGLVQNFRVYAGRQNTEVAGKHMDNYYNTVGLAKNLIEKGTYCTGTLRKDLKENPGEISKKSVKKCENVAVCKEESEKTPVSSKRGQTTDKPLPIVKYNEFMSGVDPQDQLLAFYPFERKTLRWYLKLAIHTFQLLFINSYKIFNKYSGNEKKMTLYDYRLAVINQLLPVKTASPIAGPSRRNAQSANTVHRISKIKEKNSNGKLKRKMCRQCSKFQKRTDSVWHCEMCENQPGLCFECFYIYHRYLT